MASSSTYDVYLSFRDLDTLKGFTRHLYDALMRASLRAFMDDDDSEAGILINPIKLKAIQRSRISVVVISGSHASSRWCLDELVCIMELWRREDILVLPIFYHVDPSDVRKQKGGFGQALEQFHRSETMKQTTILKWREALTQVANICGWDTKNERYTRTYVRPF